MCLKGQSDEAAQQGLSADDRDPHPWLHGNWLGRDRSGRRVVRRQRTVHGLTPRARERRRGLVQPLVFKALGWRNLTKRTERVLDLIVSETRLYPNAG